MNRTLLSAIVIFSIVFFASCSGTANVGQTGSTVSSKYPAWYPQQSVVTTDSVIYAYATAIDDDSVGAVTKAVAWAKSELQASLSQTFEGIRTDAASNQSRGKLNDPAFIMALRNAEEVVTEISSIQNTEIRTVEGFESVRSFAEVSVPKDKLIRSMGEQLSEYKKAWNAMKASQAFVEF